MPRPKKVTQVRTSKEIVSGMDTLYSACKLAHDTAKAEEDMLSAQYSVVSARRWALQAQLKILQDARVAEGFNADL